MRSYLVGEGGLGNQLFTWNAAHCLHAQNNCKVTIFMPKDTSRRNELLELFDFCSHPIKLRQSKNLFRLLRGMDRVVARLPSSKKIFELLGVAFYQSPSAKIRMSRNRSILHRGYFQSIEMVEDQSAVVLSEIAHLADVTFKEIIQKVELPKDYEAFHIRRGDFAENLDSIGVLSDNFYRKLRSKRDLVISTETIGDLTDDFGAMYVSTAASNTNWESFSILAHAQRLIIANSTFSWWAGKISKYKNPDNVVIQPRIYLKQEGTMNPLRVKDFIQESPDFI